MLKYALLCSVQCAVYGTVYDTELVRVDLNVEICREYLNSYPAGFVGEEEKGECNVAHTLTSNSHQSQTPYKRDPPRKKKSKM